ncbi:hypothetical protein CLH39_12050 [Alcaligenes faecalis]|uniref:hypothetical protein n=1 Tax=Alcaligenes faecalis TaxID=511 RepID=UPI0019313252|nr:hypothetical protein [Alcaligenes faecalis]QRF90921.1 hypothetical protein CLH39_12050 [Alcaligenes faecalis]
MSRKKKFWNELKLVARERVDSSFGLLSQWWEFRVANADSWKAAKKYRDQKNDLSEANEYYLSREASDQRLYVEHLEFMWIRRRADRMGIHVPDEYKQRELSEMHGEYFISLTNEGRAEVLKKISDEVSRRRREFVQFIGVIIGLVGAVTGLVAVLNAGAL